MEEKQINQNVEDFRKVTEDMIALYKRKNAAYGNSFSSTYNKLGILSAVTRLEDKHNRLCNLAKNPHLDDLGESVADTLIDIANYYVMTIMELRRGLQEGHKPSSKFDIMTLKPFDKVLVRSDIDTTWHVDIFGYHDDNQFFYTAAGMCSCQCIPYEGNEYLLGTTDNCDEYYKTWQ